MRRLLSFIAALWLTIGAFEILADETVCQTLIGTPVTAPAWSDDTRARLEKDLEIARVVMNIAPEREDSHIWLGRRLGYLTRNGEAIDVY